MESKNYFIHDNGGRPFMVTVESKKVSVFGRKKTLYFEDDEDEIKTWGEAQNPKFYDVPVLEIPDYSNIWIPDDESLCKKNNKLAENFALGNSILVEKQKLSYVYIGMDIKSFETLDPIVKYESPVGNNDVPYPWAKDAKNRIYLMLEDVSFHLKEDEDKGDPYQPYYFQRRGKKRRSKKVEKTWDEEHEKREMITKVLQKRWKNS